MKRTTSAQVGGKVFVFEEDAYQHIMQYLQHAQKELHESEDCNDVLQDLEYAIRERLSARDSVQEAVTLADAVLIIDVMGKVESFDNNKTQQKFSWSKLKTVPTKNAQSAILGGVCSGIAEAFEGGPAVTLLIRLAFVLFGLASFGFVALLYLLLWLIMPKDPLQSNSTSANTIIERVRRYTTDPKNKFEEQLVHLQTIARKCVRALVFFMRIIVGAVASVGMAVLVFGVIALLVWLYASDTTQELRRLPILLHIASIMFAVGVPLVAVLAAVTKAAAARYSVSAKSVVFVIVPWLSTVIASFFMIGTNKAAYENYIKKVRPDNAFVSTITIKDNVVIKCIGLGTCKEVSYFNDVERCGLTYKGVTSSYDTYIVYKPDGYWVRHDEWLVNNDEASYCKRINEVQKQYGKDSVAIRIGSLNDPTERGYPQTTWFQYNPFVYYERRDTL